MKEQTESGSRQIAPCNFCGTNTWHKVISVYTYDFIPDDDSNWKGYIVDNIAWEEWVLLQCLGCDSITVRVATLQWGDDSDEPDHIFYPERTSNNWHKREYQQLPTRLSKLYREIINTYSTDSLLLCAAGIRALLEGICDDKEITEGPNEQGRITGNLEGKINGLTAIVPSGIVRNLHSLRFLGNQALHELETPTKDDIGLALTIIEDILNVVYELDYKAQMLYDKTARNRHTTNIDRNDLPPET